MRASSIGGAVMLLAAATCVYAQAPQGGDGVSADIISHDLGTIGLSATAAVDAAHDPRLTSEVDDHPWSIVLRDCAAGALEQRRCARFQFIIDTDMPKAVPADVINKWNKEYRYARASLQQGNQIGCLRPGTCTARVVVDVLVAGTKGDPAKTFHAYFEVVRRRMDGFRRFIGAN